MLMEYLLLLSFGILNANWAFCAVAVQSSRYHKTSVIFASQIALLMEATVLMPVIPTCASMCSLNLHNPHTYALPAKKLRTSYVHTYSLLWQIHWKSYASVPKLFGHIFTSRVHPTKAGPTYIQKLRKRSLCVSVFIFIDLTQFVKTPKHLFCVSMFLKIDRLIGPAYYFYCCTPSLAVWLCLDISS